jgi:hypothetical protein
VNFTDLVGDTGVEKDALGSGGLTSVDVRHDANVANLVQVGKHVLCHDILRDLDLNQILVILGCFEKSTSAQ